ncbi:MAG TPA: NAD(P)/FAD-dependent oxidoreductase [Pirellulales bacterium]|jgi:NADH dehydrogenase|nr:NAD(P)/FAD-dependent oxidoreductase [Pirellulales bacterium]
MHRVVIVGGGFGGLRAAEGLARAAVHVTLLDRQNYHLFQPLLYQVATGTLSPANVASPLRALLKRQRNAVVLMGNVCGFDLSRREVLLARDSAGSGSASNNSGSGDAIGFDSLIVAAGSGHSYFGHPEWEQLAPSLKSLDDATEIRRRILWAFEAAERSGLSAEIEKWLTFVVVGGGPTGVELVGQIAEIAAHTLRNEFRSFDPARSQIFLIEALDRILPTFHPDLSAKARDALTHLGVNVLTGARVTQVDPHLLTIEQSGKTRQIEARTVLWAAGVEASPLGKKLAEAAGISADRSGRVPVGADLTVAGHPEVFVIGDMARLDDGSGQSLPALAPVAMQQGTYAARLIRERLAGRRLPPFHYHDRGVLATIGRWKAVADLKFIRLSGALAWLAWLFIHLMTLVQFRNRLLVFVQWGWSYLTKDRSALLITGKSPVGVVTGGSPVGAVSTPEPAASKPQSDGRANTQPSSAASPEDQATDEIGEASEESFPASDPPAWTHSSISRDP